MNIPPDPRERKRVLQSRYVRDVSAVADWRAITAPAAHPYAYAINARPIVLERVPAPVRASNVLVHHCPTRVLAGARKPKAARRGDAPTLMAADRSTAAIVQAGDHGRRHLVAAARNGGFRR